MYKNQPFLVLQYIEGTSLEEISFGRRVPPEVVVTILIDVLRGLQRAHEIGDEGGAWLGLVHGDVSAPNILVGTDGVSRLTDFGSTRFTALGEAGDPMTLGKPAYMAPEQLLQEPLDARTDLFAIGIVMWTALTGQELFAADSYDQIIANVLNKEVEPPSAFGAPVCLDAICLQALSRSREERPVSAGAMAQMLLKLGVENRMLASPAAVGEYVRREVTDADLERRRRMDAAFKELEAPRPAPAGEPSVTVHATAAVSATHATAERKFSQTMIIPERARRLVLARRWLKSRGAEFAATARRWLQGDGVIFVALWVALAVLAAMATVAIVHHKIKPAHRVEGTAGR
jgi:serine/threonine protein kinase